MANLLSLRAAKADVLVRFDAAFFDGPIASLLAKRGFAHSASATGPADLRIDGDGAAIERFLGGRAAAPACRLVAAARVWRALVVVDDGRGRPTGRSRDVGAQGGWSAAMLPATDSVRGPGGRRIKARPRRRTARLPDAPPPPTTAASTPAASDPAAFALGHLLRLAERVVDAVRDVNDDLVVTVDGGRVVVDGVDRGMLGGA